MLCGPVGGAEEEKDNGNLSEKYITCQAQAPCPTQHSSLLRKHNTPFKNDR